MRMFKDHFDIQLDQISPKIEITLSYIATGNSFTEIISYSKTCNLQIYTWSMRRYLWNSPGIYWCSKIYITITFSAFLLYKNTSFFYTKHILLNIGVGFLCNVWCWMIISFKRIWISARRFCFIVRCQLRICKQRQSCCDMSWIRSIAVITLQFLESKRCQNWLRYMLLCPNSWYWC